MVASGTGQTVEPARPPTVTGLTWQRVVTTSSAKLDWQAAIDHCKSLEDDGGWRLPNISELLTLVDRQHAPLSVDQTAFPNSPPSWFWTSTTRQGKNYVRCVK